MLTEVLGLGLGLENEKTRKSTFEPNTVIQSIWIQVFCVHQLILK